jgi:hypothetical protein
MKMPHHPFFLFGMGNRRKFLYKGGTLFDALTGEILRSWSPINEYISPHEYCVRWQSREGKMYSIREDEEGVSLKVEGTQTFLTQGPIRLPDFKGSSHAQLLRVLLHEILINVLDGKPLTNFLVQSLPSYRDAAIICEVLNKTGNLHLVKEWLLGLDQPFDYLHGKEPDNLGEALYLISLASDRFHPLVPIIHRSIETFRKTDYIEGRTEGGEHPVYQTKWLKFGLKSLGLPDEFKVPVAFDPYSSVFWMDYRDIGNNGPPFPEKIKESSPHLAWAEAHFHKWNPPMPTASRNYPLSWEVQTGQGYVHGMGLISPDLAGKEIITPHARHASEMMLYFLDKSPSETWGRHLDLNVLQAH